MPSLIAAQPSPEARLVGFKFYEAGSYVGTYYTIKPADGETAYGEGEFICSETREELSWPEIDGDEYCEPFPEEDAANPYDGFGASVMAVKADEMAAFQAELEVLGVLGWNGFDEHYTPPEGVLDMDNMFVLKMVYSDGTRVVARGYNRNPEGYSDVWNAVRAFFEAHEDRSASYPPAFPDEKATRLTIDLGSPNGGNRPRWKIELVEGWHRWSICLKDPNGEVLPAGTDIQDYADIEGELPFDAFLDILRKYDLESWNGTDEHGQGGGESCYISIFFANDKAYVLDTNILPDNYEAFRNECVLAIADYYEEVRG